jgi:hypothetical protein
VAPSSYDGRVPGIDAYETDAYETGTTTVGPVPFGPQAYRRSMRRLGPLVGLIPAIVLLGAMTAAKAVVSCPAAGACNGRAVTSWVLPALALPTAVLAGLPIETGTTRLAIVAVTSALVWMVIGRIAASRATARPIASWRDFVREFAWLAVAVWIGVLVGIALIGAGIGGLNQVL